MSEENDIDLEDLEAQYEGKQPPPKDEEDEDLEDDDELVDNEEEDEPEPEGDELPGYKTYEQWVAEGKDPEMYKGKKAYAAEYKRIQDNKQLKSDLAEVKGLVKSVVEASNKRETQLREEMKRDLEAKLKQQKDEMDVDGALETKEQLDALEKDKPKPHTPEINPVIKSFMQENPLIDRDSDQFNEDFFADVSRLQAKGINAMSDQGGADLSDAQILKITKRAFEQAKELNAELFRSPRNDRQGMSRKPDQQQRGGKGASLETRIKGAKVDARNSELNGNAAWDIYTMLKEKDPKEAELFAKEFLGDD